MKIQTFSIVVGGPACNAKCPYCVSKLTGCTNGIKIGQKAIDINKRNFDIACNFAKQSGVSTVLMTGKGEPLLYKEHINRYFKMLQKWQFPFIELQTNGVELKNIEDTELIDWYNMGLTTISLSVAHWLLEANKYIFGTDIHLAENINRLHRLGFSIRISCVGVKNMIDDLAILLAFVKWCKGQEVEQFTWRPVTNISEDEIGDDTVKRSVYEWIKSNKVDERNIEAIADWFDLVPNLNATTLLTLAHGAKVYDVWGQNISLNSCLTRSDNPDDIRQLIFSSDGHLRFDWVKEGAIII